MISCAERPFVILTSCMKKRILNSLQNINSNMNSRRPLVEWRCTLVCVCVHQKKNMKLSWEIFKFGGYLRLYFEWFIKWILLIARIKYSIYSDEKLHFKANFDLFKGMGVSWVTASRLNQQKLFVLLLQGKIEKLNENVSLIVKINQNI